jgi:hypothetical protein
VGVEVRIYCICVCTIYVCEERERERERERKRQREKRERRGEDERIAGPTNYVIVIIFFRKLYTHLHATLPVEIQSTIELFFG